MNILGVYYTHNRLNNKLFQTSLDSVKLAQSTYNLKTKSFDCKLIVSSWSKLDDSDNKPNVREYQYSFYRTSNHLNIITQLLRAIYSSPKSELIVFLEHDVIYPETYFLDIEDTIKGSSHQFNGVSNLNYIGLNSTGYLKVIQQDQPLSQISLLRDIAIEVLEQKLRECIVIGQCTIEPDRGNLLRIQPNLKRKPCIHVNMNQTLQNHHLTNHYDCYEKVSSFPENHSKWGSFKNFNLF